MARILVIEDDASIRGSLCRLLRLQGHEAAEAENGLLGVAVARRNRPDLILCDVLMPELDGFGVLAAIRADSSTARTPFIFSHGERRPGRRAPGHRAGSGRLYHQAVPSGAAAAGGLGPVHMVRAFATGLGIVLGQEKVADKSNEITAIPTLLEALAIQGCLVSIDAMGTQREIARAIRDMGADYLLAVKGNQPTLHEALEGAFVGRWDEVHNAVQTGHGRQVFQIYRTLANTGEVDTATWIDCAMLGRVDSVRVVDGTASPVETRYYISSRTLSTADFAAAVRDHWAIENRLHWSLDVIFGEDARRLSEDNAPQNFSLLTKMALNLLRQQPPEGKKKSLRMRRKRIDWDDDARMALLGLSPL